MRLTKLVAALGLSIGLAVPAIPASAQDAQDENAWVKICNKDTQANKELCLITQELRTQNGQFLASAAIREFDGESRRSLLLSVPVGMLIQPGVQIQIDGSQPEQAPYQICFPNACYAEKTIDDGFISRLKRGGKMAVNTINRQGKQVRFDMTLIGFTAAYDGAGIDPQALQQKQTDLQSALEKKAQEARDRLLAAQQDAVEKAD
ncbi:invasion associated locus B family protein [Acuticoccus sp. I52.16.1]|uniref:invasion associated locus B family protein n=1 Tax=Acuticoccus sp. I52.16.1 TaxID=2928472 RepID=UPI001FD495BB|nr:invasion associated locus B family protein [Acuticoccus sp. I52.16.1]UOM34565.1 invasion associated locus B family protein [Acuticoccus sp. I52.16.1]